MTPDCIKTPISWLDLERYALAEMDRDEREAVAAHLEACEACRSCMDHLESHEPIALPALPSLPEAPWWRRWFALPALATAAVAAAVIVLFVLRSGDPGEKIASVYPAQRVGVKGGELAIELLRDAGEPSVYVSGDRFKVLVTCPPGFGDQVEIAVFQNGEKFSPIPTTPISCGNRVAVPGAFSITGDTPVYVCASVGGETVCAKIDPAR